MKINKCYWICPIIITGIIFIIINSCKKDDDIRPAGNTITDVDGNVYSTVIIGTQTWMAENLKVTRYRNGDLIGTTVPDTLDISEESNAKYQWAFNYPGIESSVTVANFGRLYTWYAVTDSRGVCPPGWHLPADSEWTTLTEYLGGYNVVGGKLKERGIIHWNEPNAGATNESGFNAVAGGARSSLGLYGEIRSRSYWWSSSEHTSEVAWAWGLSYFNTDLGRYYGFKNIGVSVRCIKD